MTTPTPKRVFVVIPRQAGRRLLLDHLRQHGLTGLPLPAINPPHPGDTHTGPPRYDPPHTSKQDPQ